MTQKKRMIFLDTLNELLYNGDLSFVEASGLYWQEFGFPVRDTKKQKRGKNDPIKRN